MRTVRTPLWHISKQRASCGPHCPRSNYMESGVLLMAVLVPRENLQDEDGERSLARQRRGEGDPLGETGRKKLRRRGEERIKQGEKEERFPVARKEWEARFDVLLWSLRARRQGGRTEPLIFRHHFSFAPILYCHATAVKWTEHLLTSLTCKENVWSDEDNTFDNETPFSCWNLEICINDKFRNRHIVWHVQSTESIFFNLFALANIINFFSIYIK